MCIEGELTITVMLLYCSLQVSFSPIDKVTELCYSRHELRIIKHRAILIIVIDALWTILYGVNTSPWVGASADRRYYWHNVWLGRGLRRYHLWSRWGEGRLWWHWERFSSWSKNILILISDTNYFIHLFISQ